MLEVKKLEVKYDEIQAVWGIDLKVETGKIVGLLGPNGAGKTSTFNTIAGTVKPSGGHIFFEDKDITKLNSKFRVSNGIALVPEGRKLFPFMTVLENLILGAYTKRVRERKDELLERVYQLFPVLEEKASQQAKDLSGGQQQMVAVARGLMSDPKLLILDEPSLGLAPIIVQDIFAKFNEINKSGVTILISEQHVSMVFEVMDYGYILEEGKIALEGTADELNNNPHVKEAYIGI